MPAIMGVMDYTPENHRHSETGYRNPDILKAAADEMCPVIGKLAQDKKVIFVGWGGSGIALATACALNYNVYEGTARLWISHHKENITGEWLAYTHGNSDDYYLVIVDDHIHSGDTMNKVLDLLKPIIPDLVYSITCSPGTTINGAKNVLSLR